MDGFSNGELADMHMMYGAAGGNARRAVRMYTNAFPNRRVPGHRFFTNLHMRLRETGSLRPNQRVNGGRPVHREVVNEEQVVQYFEENPRASTRSASRVLGINNHVDVWRALNNNNWHPFHFQRVQALLANDYQPRLDFAHWFLQQEEADEDFARRILWTDEAFFNRDGVFNLHNSHIWSVENPHAMHPHGNQYRFSVNVWAGIVGNHLVGPYLMPTPLNGHSYMMFLQEGLPQLLENIPLDIRRGMWYQHDGAPAHYYAGARNVLDRQFPNRWIGRNGPVAWPARSPDMTPLDFFFWGAMKDLVYATPVLSEFDLIGRIVAAAGDIAEIPNVFSSVRQSLHKRFQKCVEVNGGHFEQLL